MTNTKKKKNNNNNNNNNGSKGKRIRRKRASVSSVPYAERQLMLNRSQLSLGAVPEYRILPGSTPGGIRVIGRDLLNLTPTAMSAVGAYVPDSLNLQLDLGGTVFVTRLATYASLFDLWKPRGMRVTFVSSQPTTATGLVYLAISRETSGFTAPASATSIMRYLKASMGPVYSTISTETDERFNAVEWYQTETTITPQFAGYICFGSDSGNAAVVPGKLFIDYDVEFAQPSAQ